MQKGEKVEGGMTTTNSRFHMGSKKPHTGTSKVEKTSYIRHPTDHTVQELEV